MPPVHYVRLAIELAIVLGVGVEVELIARYWLKRTRYYVRRPMAAGRFSPDPGLFPTVEREILIQINEDGERGGPVPKDGRVFRVLIAGGSSVECWFSDQETNWGAVVEKRLSTAENLAQLGADHVHVGNVGKSGVDIGSLRMIFEKILSNYQQLDAIVLMVGASDVVRWMEIGGPPDRPVTMMTPANCFDQNPGREFQWRPKQSGIAEVVRRLEPRLRRRPKQGRGAGTWMHRARDMRRKATKFRAEPGDTRIVLEVFDRYLRDVLAMCQAKAPRVIIARQPWFQKESFTPEEEALFWHGGVGQAFRELVTEFYSHEALFKLMGEVDAHSARVAEEVGAMHIDLRGEMEMSARNFYDHFHFTSEGCRAVGESVARKILYGNSIPRITPAPVLERQA